MHRRLRKFLVFLVPVVVVAAIAVVAIARTGGQQTASSSPTAIRPTPARTADRKSSTPQSVSVSWSFTKRLPSGWSLDARLPSLSFRFGPARVATHGGQNAYQLLAPVERVPAGRYTISVAGRVQAGGIGVGLQDVTTGRWLSYRGFGGPTRGGKLSLVADLPRAHLSRIILTNYARAQGSTWTIDSVTLHAVPLPTTTAFSSSIPAGWSLAGGATVSPVAGSLHVITGTAPYEYALVSPSGYLSPGTHTVAASVHVLVGGFGLGVLSVRANKWLAYHNFSSNPASQTVKVPLTLPAGETVRLVLSNFGNKVLGRSEWDLASVTVK